MQRFDHQSGTHLQTNGAEIYYEVHGGNDQPVLLLLHGGFGNMEDFNSILPWLGPKYKTIGIDSRGQGKSTLGEKGLSYEMIAKDVEQVLTALQVTSLSILGFSDGGIVAYRLVQNTPFHIERVVTVGADWHARNQEPLRERFMQITPDSWREKFPETYEAYQALNPAPDFDRLTETLVSMWLDPGEHGYPGESVTGIACPLVIMRGEKDHLFSADSAEALRRRVKNATLVTVPGTGHMPFAERPESFMKALNGFL